VCARARARAGERAGERAGTSLTRVCTRDSRALRGVRAAALASIKAVRCLPRRGRRDSNLLGPPPPPLPPPPLPPFSHHRRRPPPVISASCLSRLSLGFLSPLTLLATRGLPHVSSTSPRSPRTLASLRAPVRGRQLFRADFLVTPDAAAFRIDRASVTSELSA